MKRFFSSLAEGLLEPRRGGLVLFLCLAWLTLLAGIRPLMLPDEGRYVGVAWGMLSSGDWLVPTLDGLPFFHKPPLFYWLTGLALQVFGSNDWAARLASVIGAALATGALYLFVSRHGDKRLAGVSAVVLVSQPMFFAGAQYANLDMLVAGMISATIVCGASAILRLDRGLPYRTVLAAAYVFAALGVLAKGLIGFVLPGAVLLAWLLLGKRYRLIPALLSLPMLLLFVAVAAPWFLWMQKSYSGFWDYFFVYHHFQRFAHSGFSNARPFWFYLPVVLLGALPWSPWIVRLGAPKFLVDPPRCEMRSLMIVWLLAILVFFSWPNSKLIGYIFPALPPLAYLLADAILTWLQKRQDAQRADASGYLGGSVLLAGSLCVAFVALVGQFDPTSTRALSRQVAPLFSADDQLVMIDEYEYDLPFYLRARKNSWVVSDWQDADIPLRDNWRKELFDAGRFAPIKAQEVLLLAGELAPRLCALGSGTVWIWGKTAQAARYPFLSQQTVAFSDGKKAVWRFDDAQRRRLAECAARSPAPGFPGAG
ncbi:MAG: glycosyltransferase family 39 protein [Candidatus Accumulibacter sp.]|uniref:ArnT family glycosyltransferase n=2 Tax=Accumulibacter sp. TaxID=2053492 RepID=UPI0025F95B6F|nr:glycosyltransferase family 39 protein [Accumulibacter sp.]MCP5247611.1 glycosyltransferase family 39 protein [Accumulibacter sp.]